MERQSVSIAGAGKVEGGSYERVKISGSGKVTGNTEAEEFKGAGAVTVEGSLRAKRLEVAGSFKAAGGVEVEEGEVSGSFKADGKLTAREFRASGVVKCGPIGGGYIRVAGELKTGGDVEGDTVRLTGAFKVEGLIAADRVEVRLEGHSKAKELGGERIQVCRGPSWGGLLSTLGRLLGAHAGGLLEVEAVEGDEIDIEWVVADVVRGRVVKLGPGCRVGRVEYQESLEVHPQAQVAEEAKT
ncbi:MAG: bactofilin [Candidatus Bipolaricaulaceae bacterium]